MEVLDVAAGTGNCDEWNLDGAADARFEQEYLIAIGTRA